MTTIPLLTFMPDYRYLSQSDIVDGFTSPMIEAWQKIRNNSFLVLYTADDGLIRRWQVVKAGQLATLDQPTYIIPMYASLHAKEGRQGNFRQPDDGG